ncbi:uncharacterized protein LOC132273618 [Cornus florida]|uniref:uncharacterized protein LOC132273618 n=1 Tax=Cornus florida TaxID=4283 RepID=UPI00289DE1D4|nr:uncharacterized protein LOC132273618 [Cornus florida]
MVEASRGILRLELGDDGGAGEKDQQTSSSTAGGRAEGRSVGGSASSSRLRRRQGGRVNSVIGYALMLAIMSFNGSVFITVVAGLSVGYLVFKSSNADVVVVDNPCACA